MLLLYLTLDLCIGHCLSLLLSYSAESYPKFKLILKCFKPPFLKLRGKEHTVSVKSEQE